MTFDIRVCGPMMPTREGMKRSATVHCTDKISAALRKVDYIGLSGRLTFRDCGQGMVSLSINKIEGWEPLSKVEIPADKVY